MDDDQRPKGPPQRVLFATALGSALLTLLVLILCCCMGGSRVITFVVEFLTDPTLT